MFRFIKYALYIISFTVIIYVFYYYRSFYFLGFLERPRHLDYSFLKPSGFLSHGLGILGSSMLLLLLLYSLRKRSNIFGKLGAVRKWLDIHIFFGTVGPLFIILHSTFKLNGLVSVSFWSMVLVALSGFVGRYLYIQIPRSIRGNELSVDEINQQRVLLDETLLSKYPIDEKEILDMEKAVAGSFDGGLIRMLSTDLFRFIRLYAIERQLRRRKGIPKNKAKKLVKLLTQKALLDRRINILSRVHKLFHYWHVFHKPFAILMYIIMFVHVGIVVWLGYTWF